jgi:NAD(P)-dependent dehydrogenase (short-subunit alcohol dehydrogenase family)
LTPALPFLGGLEEVSDAEVRKRFETRLFGLLSVTRAALPVLRATEHSRYCDGT